MLLTRETEELGEKPVPVPLFPLQIPGANPGLRGERPSTNDLSHGTASQIGLPSEKKEIPDNVSWIHSLPSPRDRSIISSLSVQDTKMFNTSTS
jgi:hypothetical protein